MKNLLFTIGFLLASWQGQAQMSYNAALADSLGADAFGMKKYVFALLTTGSNTTKDTAYIKAQFQSHFKNINKLSAEKKLVVAGPYMKNDAGMRGIFILNTADTIEARKWLQEDGAIANDILRATLWLWYGSAALPLYLPYHVAVSKEKL